MAIAVPSQLRSGALRYTHPLGGRRQVWPATRPHRADLGKGSQEEPAAGARDQRLARVEAVLFLSREPQSTRKISRLANLADGTEARTLIRLLNERYDTEGSAFRVEEVAGGYQLMTRPRFATWLRRIHPSPIETRLSAPAMETLAVVAYRQPVVRARIENIRGVQCGEMLRQLMDRELVKIAGRSEELGRPYLYATTRRFLQVFGLRSLDDLPQAEQFLEPQGDAVAMDALAEEESIAAVLTEQPPSESDASPVDALEAPRSEIEPELDDEEDEDDDDEYEYEYEDDDDELEEDDDEYEYEYEDDDEELEEDDEDDDDEYEYEDDDEDEYEDEDEDDEEVDDDFEEGEWEEVEDEDEEDDESEDDEEEWEDDDEEEWDEDDDEYEYDDEDEDDEDEQP